MTDVIDIFTKKKLKEADKETTKNKYGHKIPSPPSNTEDYLTRIDKCIAVYMETGKDCTCDFCKDKHLLAAKLAEISRWLILDSNEKTGRKLQVGDWLEIVTLAKMRVENYILKS